MLGIVWRCCNKKWKTQKFEKQMQRSIRDTFDLSWPKPKSLLSYIFLDRLDFHLVYGQLLWGFHVMQLYGLKCWYLSRVQCITHLNDLIWKYNVVTLDRLVLCLVSVAFVFFWMRFSRIGSRCLCLICFQHLRFSRSFLVCFVSSETKQFCFGFRDELFT